MIHSIKRTPILKDRNRNNSKRKCKMYHKPCNIIMANEIYTNSYWGDISNEDWGNIYTSILNK